MKYRALFYVFFWLLLHGAQAQESSTAPVVYYYEPLEHAYVVHQVNSVEGWIFADGVMPENHNAKSGPGWSPSHEWFAWASGAYGGGGGAFVSSPWIVRRGETQRVTALDGFTAYSLDMEWSPTADLLLVNFYDSRDHEQTPSAIVVDPAKNEIVLTFDSMASGMGWSPDGRYIEYVRTIDPESAQPRYESVFVSTDGAVVFTRPLFLGNRCISFTAWLPDNRFLSISPDGDSLILVDIPSQSTDIVPVPTGNIQRIEWSPNGQYGLVYTGAPCGTTTDETQLWLFSLATLSLVLIHDNVAATQVEDYFYDHDTRLVVSWSPDSRHALYWTSSGIFIYDVDRQQIIRTAIDTRMSADNLKMRWLSDSRRIAVSWGGRLFIYDHVSDELVSLAEGVRDFEVSPDGELVAVSVAGVCDLSYLCTLDSRSGEVVGSIPFPSSARNWGGQAEFMWHTDSQWLIVGLLDADVGRQYLMLTDAAGRHRRELALCHVSDACVGWLPDTSGLSITWGRPHTVLPLPDLETNLGAQAGDIQWDPSGRLIAVSTIRDVQVIAADTLAQAWEVSLSVGESVLDLQWRDDFLLVAISDSNHTEWSDDDENRLVVIEGDSGTVVQEYRNSFINIGSTVITSLNRDTHVLEVRRWRDRGLLLQKESVIAAAISGNDVFGTVDLQTGIASAWHIAESGAAEPLKPLEAAENSPVIDELRFYELLITADGRHLILGRFDRNVTIWDIATGALIQTLPVFRFNLTRDQLDLTVSGSTVPDGLVGLYFESIPAEMLEIDGEIVYHSAETQRLITYDQRTIRVWDLASAEVILSREVWLWYTYKAPLAVSPDGRYLALTGQIGLSGEDAVEIYDFETLQLLKRYNSTAYDMYWSPDSTRLAAVTLDTVSEFFVP